MARAKEKAPAGTGAAALDNNEQLIVNSEDTTETHKKQDNGTEPELDYLQVGFEHGCAILDDIEIGEEDLLKFDLDALNRVRSAHLTKPENEALNTLLGAEIKQRKPPVQAQMIHLLGLKQNYDELAELYATVGVLPRGISWAEMADLVKDPSWAWEPWLPNGFVTIIAGEPGEGKSILCLKIGACFLRGDPWPDGTPYEAETGAVLWCEAESAQALNLGRAKAWGLPVEKIYSPKIADNPMTDVVLDLTDHQDEVTAMANWPDVRLIVVDSLRGAHRGDENSSGSMEVVQWLAQLARDINKPLILTHHLRKRGMFDLDGRVNLERVRGSSAIIQTSRVVWAIDRPDMEMETRRLSVIKNNIARFPEPVGVDITDMGIDFGDAPEAPREYSELDRAVDFLLDLLDKEPIWQKDVEHEAKGAGLAWSTVRRAKRKLRIVSDKSTDDQKWYWGLPAQNDDQALIH